MGHEELNQMLFKNNLGQSDRNLSFSTLGSRSMQCPEDFHGYTSLPLLRYRCTTISGCLWILCFRILRWPWSFQWSGLPLPVYLSICPGSALTSVTKGSSCWVVLYVQNLYRILKSQTLSVTGRDYLIQCPPPPFKQWETDLPSSKRRGQDPKPSFHPRASYSSLSPIGMHPIWALVLSGALACLLSVTVPTDK